MQKMYEIIFQSLNLLSVLLQVLNLITIDCLYSVFYPLFLKIIYRLTILKMRRHYKNLKKFYDLSSCKELLSLIIHHFYIYCAVLLCKFLQHFHIISLTSTQLFRKQWKLKVIFWCFQNTFILLRIEPGFIIFDGRNFKYSLHK